MIASSTARRNLPPSCGVMEAHSIMPPLTGYCMNTPPSFCARSSPALVAHAKRVAHPPSPYVLFVRLSGTAVTSVNIMTVMPTMHAQWARVAYRSPTLMTTLTVATRRCPPLRPPPMAFSPLKSCAFMAGPLGVVQNLICVHSLMLLRRKWCRPHWMSLQIAIAHSASFVAPAEVYVDVFFLHHVLQFSYLF